MVLKRNDKVVLCLKCKAILLETKDSKNPKVSIYVFENFIGILE